jgi:triacylglycerol lipase
MRFQDTLAAGQRLWVHGRVCSLPATTNGNGESKRWWQRWRKGDPLPPSTLKLETRISGTVFEAEVPVQPDGQFETTFTAALPPARRSWRVARHKIEYADHVAEAGNVVLAPSADASAGIVVILPLEATWPADAVGRLAPLKAAPHLPKLIKKLKQVAGRCNPIYYLACVPPQSEDRRPELALAAAELGLPAGHFILLCRPAKDAAAALVAAVDRLRWLFAGTLDLWMLNLEPCARSALETSLGAKEDRAAMRKLSEGGEEAAAPAGQLPAPKTPQRVPVLRPTRAILLPKHPVVFCHGMLAFSMLKMYWPEEQNYFTPLRDYLGQRGFRVLFPEVPATSGVVERAGRLRELILNWTDEPVNLIAHSMGGLDARYMITHLGMAEQVHTLTTIATPHHGSYLADWFQANYRKRVPLLLALEAVGMNVDGFRDCRLDACRELNAHTPDMPQVRYFSFGGEVTPSHLTPFLRRAWNILTPVEGPNDGLVSVASARWGEFLGTIRADHFAQTPDSIFLRSREDFDSLGFFTRLVEDLARRGF